VQKYVLGQNGKKARDNQKTEILCIERCRDFLKPETGKMAIVLPDGILTNSSLQYVRDFLMQRCQILAVVSLPGFAFAHFGAGVKSSLVFVRRKGGEEKIGRYKIFMAIAEHIGYDATGRRDVRNDLEASIMAPATPFCLCAMQKHLTIERTRCSMIQLIILSGRKCPAR